MKPEAFRVAVIGGGVNGLATAWNLVSRDEERIALIERFEPGHDRGSSHGEGRITRSSYGDPLYVRLMQIAHAEDWPRLEHDAGEPLIERADGAYFGPADGPFEDYARAVAAVGVDVERLTPAEARRRFPAFAFPDATGVLHDRTGGVVAAARTVRALTRRSIVHGLHVLAGTRVLAIDPTSDPVTIDTDRGRVLAERVVVAAGAWAASLVPSLRDRLAVHRQHVGYFRLSLPPAAVRPGAFPVWVHLGARGEAMHYGLPEFGTPGIKAAAHVVAGPGNDPDGARDPDERALARVEQFLRAQLAAPVEARLHAETCLYTSSDDEDFVVGPLGENPRVIVASACSGHGFKFAPLMGRIVAELALEGRTRVAPFEAERARFAP